MMTDNFISMLSTSSSVEGLENAFFDYVEKQQFRAQIEHMVACKDSTSLGKIGRKGITLYEDDTWLMLITLDAFATQGGVANTFASESLYCVISDHHYVVGVYPELNGVLTLSGENSLTKTKNLKILAKGHAYVFHGQQEKVVVALHNKSVLRDVCPQYEIATGNKIASYSGTQNLERHKVLIGFLPQFGATGAPYLSTLTKHKINAIRWQALVELFKVDHQLAKSILIEFLEDPCQIIRAQAKATLDQLTEFEEAC
ncbi:hypothetical protein L1285_13065 [Pseudoalteromonas sp. DL2-H2.2]|uniref:hypothetical protein n=1 Tax=Pseudoalteromonas sp. DL2-H2.2 TaxID=2908889 RepID=UPI001F1B3556|nr:hypothetical protein [Pseudoalteromonas sp. DL2-H2.2]MCF2909252.1 hypothetical protein [Pseudoalteromonas sp. DL2-H2.2]